MAASRPDLSSDLTDNGKGSNSVSGNVNGFASGLSSNDPMSMSYNSLRGKDQKEGMGSVVNKSPNEAPPTTDCEERQPLLSKSFSPSAPRADSGQNYLQSKPDKPQTESVKHRNGNAPLCLDNAQRTLLSSSAPMSYQPGPELADALQSKKGKNDKPPFPAYSSREQGNEEKQRQATLSFISSKWTRGLKLFIPASHAGNVSMNSSLTQQALGKDKSSGMRGRKSFHWHASITNNDSSINDDYNYYSGRRSAPVFSRRHYSGTPKLSGDRGSNQALTFVGNLPRRKSAKSDQRRSDPEPEPYRKSYGAVQTDECRHETTKSVFRSEQTSYTTARDNHTFDQASREDGNKAVGQGYWSEFESEDQRPKIVISQYFNSKDLSKSPLSHEDETDRYLSNESLDYADDDLQRGEPLSLSISEYLSEIRRCKSETWHTVSFSFDSEQLAFDGRVKSPLINDTGDNFGERLPPRFIDDEEEDDSENTPLIGPGKRKVSEDDDFEIKTGVYSRRWYILLLFSVYCLIWNAIWSTWGPIAQSAKAVFDWSDANIAMFTWLGNIPFLVTMFPMAYLMDVKGMRGAMLLSCGLSFLGAGLRCVTSSPETATWFISAGQLLNGIAGTVPVSGAALVSGLWFPQSQRTTATGISTVMGYLGVCFSFVTGPLLVPEPDFSDPANATGIGLLTDSFNSSNGTDFNVQRDGVMSLLYYECGAMGVIFLLTLIYCPSKPPLPPSVSASMPRESYLKGLKMLTSNKQFWLTALAFSVPVGVYEVWQIVLDVNLDPMVSQETAGWMDFYATLGGCGAGLLVSRFADLFTRQMRLFLIVFYTLAAVASLWFTLLAVNILPFDMVSIYVATVVCGLFLDGAAPLFFELVIEVSYPVGEGVTSGFLQMLCSSAGIVFLSLMQVESMGKSWMNWCLVGCISASIPFLLFIRSSLGRADIDDGLTSDSYTTESDDDIKQEPKA